MFFDHEFATTDSMCATPMLNQKSTPTEVSRDADVAAGRIVIVVVVVVVVVQIDGVVVVVHKDVPTQPSLAAVPMVTINCCYGIVVVVVAKTTYADTDTVKMTVVAVGVVVVVVVVVELYLR